MDDPPLHVCSHDTCFVSHLLIAAVDHFIFKLTHPQVSLSINGCFFSSFLFVFLFIIYGVDSVPAPLAPQSDGV